MIQEILPHRLDHTFRNMLPVSDDCFFSFYEMIEALRVR